MRFIILAGEIETKTKPLTSKLPGDLNASRRLPDVVGEKGSQQVQSQTIKNSISAILKSCPIICHLAPTEKQKWGKKIQPTSCRYICIYVLDCGLCLFALCAANWSKVQKYQRFDPKQRRKINSMGRPTTKKQQKNIKKNTRSEWQTKSNKRQRQIANLTNRA